ncbi:hypothetical protein OC835_005175 [Tilletia horrida]|nr:hypothetical protein OC835_005175 [Tilletia horrida]
MASSSEDRASECLSLQADELTALASILPSDEFEQLSSGGAISSRTVVQLRIPVHFGQPRKVRIISITPAQAAVATAAAGCAAHAHDVPAHAGGGGGSNKSGSLGGTRQGISAPPPEASSSRAAEEGSAPASTTLELQHLPPLTLRLSLPPTYPLDEPPQIDSLEAAWLQAPSSSARTAPSSQAEWVRRRLREQWEESRAEVLWSWAEWVREGLWDEVDTGGAQQDQSAEERGGWWPSNAVESDKQRDGDGFIPLFEVRALHGAHTSPRLADVLTAYNDTAETTAFQDATFYCSICLEERKGKRCARVRTCGHIFCTDCLLDYCRIGMKDGQTEILCPDPGCTKAGVAPGQRHAGTDGRQDRTGETKSLLSDSELILLVGQEEFARFAAVRKKTIAEADPSAAYCPVVGCGGVVLGRKEDEGTSFEALRECDQCGFAFCRWCAKAWHGKTPCELSAVSKLASAWLSSAPDSEERAALIRKYGAANLLRLVRTYEEERANRAWLSSHTTRCPHCGCSVEKSHGCNHLTCRPCGTHFCFLCGERLNPAHPYAHFNTPGKPCYQRLFEGLLREPVDGLLAPDEAAPGDVDQGWGGGGGGGMQDFWVGPEDEDIPWGAVFTQG